MSELTSRDYKGSGRHPSPPSGGLKEFLLGALAGGLLAGLGTGLVMHHAHASKPAACAASGSAARAPASPRAPSAQAPAPSGRLAATRGPAAGRTPVRKGAGPSELARTGVSGGPHGTRGGPSPAKTQPQYDFYQMLPNLKVTVPPPTAPGAHSVGANGHSEFAGYVLQVGAYRDDAQARRVVAYLDSLGILAHIDRVHEGAAALYRVRIGPIIEQSELNRFRGVLKRVGLPAVLIPGATH